MAEQLHPGSIRIKARDIQVGDFYPYEVGLGCWVASIAPANPGYLIFTDPHGEEFVLPADRVVEIVRPPPLPPPPTRFERERDVL